MTDIIHNAARLGRRLKARRVLRGWRQTDLAAAAGVTRGTIARLERGLPGHRATIAAVARALGVEPVQLSEATTVEVP